MRVCLLSTSLSAMAIACIVDQSHLAIEPKQQHVGRRFVKITTCAESLCAIVRLPKALCHTCIAVVCRNDVCRVRWLHHTVISVSVSVVMISANTGIQSNQILSHDTSLHAAHAHASPQLHCLTRCYKVASRSQRRSSHPGRVTAVATTEAPVRPVPGCSDQHVREGSYETSLVQLQVRQYNLAAWYQRNCALCSH